VWCCSQALVDRVFENHRVKEDSYLSQNWKTQESALERYRSWVEKLLFVLSSGNREAVKRSLDLFHDYASGSWEHG
jgi:hypothetical protein